MNLLPGQKNAFGFCYQHGIIGVESKHREDSISNKKSDEGFFDMRCGDLVVIWNSDSQNYNGDSRLYIGEITDGLNKGASKKDLEEYAEFNIVSFRKCPLHEIRASALAMAGGVYGHDPVYEWERKYLKDTVEHVGDGDEKNIVRKIWLETMGDL
ncbi:MAG: hypothetical protein MPK31_07135 [Gammaproteobacteria bacterium]|nr:hypothetical protein [Gammaproteobacteria bacterium]MDA8002585.1 hypothetical protein [Alphaproteobacteria bacterium]